MDQTSNDMDDFPQWAAQRNPQQSFNEANIDPKLLNNVGTWSSEESSNSNSNSIPTAEQVVQDVNRSVDTDVEMTHATTAPAHIQPAFPMPATDEWQVVQTPRHKHNIRQQQNMLPTPDTSYHSHQRGQIASAYQPVGPSWDPNNPYGWLNLETAQMPQYQDLAAGNAVEQYGALTPTSHSRFFGDVPVAPSPLAERGLSHHAYGQTMHDQPLHAVNVHGWNQTDMAPSQDIPAWNEGAYSVPNAPNTLPPPPNSTSNINKCKKKSSLRSGLTTGSFICSHPNCGKAHDSKSELDHHARNHDPSKRTKLCPICGKDFLFEKDVKRHMNKHQKERHIFCNYIDCPWRRKGFSRQDHLERHLRTKHKQEGGT